MSDYRLDVVNVFPRIIPGGIDTGLPISYAGSFVGNAQILNFLGGGVTVSVNISNPNQIDVDISGSGGGTITGSGTPGQVTFWNGVSSVTSNSGFLYDGTNVTVGGATHLVGPVTLGTTGTALGSVVFSGSTSGAVTMQPQAVAGTFNFNLPTTAGTSGQVLTSGGGGASPMTWTSISYPTGANPTAVVGVTAVNGVATTFMRSDAAPAISSTLFSSGTQLNTLVQVGVNSLNSGTSASSTTF